MGLPRQSRSEGDRGEPGLGGSWQKRAETPNFLILVSLKALFGCTVCYQTTGVSAEVCSQGKTEKSRVPLKKPT